ncbi:MAG: hypothetical protein ACFFCO_05635 [Promethearchaeota archaeon]
MKPKTVVKSPLYRIQDTSEIVVRGQYRLAKRNPEQLKEAIYLSIRDRRGEYWSKRHAGRSLTFRYPIRTK